MFRLTNHSTKYLHLSTVPLHYPKSGLNIHTLLILSQPILLPINLNHEGVLEFNTIQRLTQTDLVSYMCSACSKSLR